MIQTLRWFHHRYRHRRQNLALKDFNRNRARGDTRPSLNLAVSIGLCLDVLGNQLGHLEHGNALLSSEDYFQGFVGIDLRPDLFVL